MIYVVLDGLYVGKTVDRDSVDKLVGKRVVGLGRSDNDMVVWLATNGNKALVKRIAIYEDKLTHKDISRVVYRHSHKYGYVMI